MDALTTERAHPLVVGVDYSELGELALERACDVAQGYKRAHLHVIHAWQIGTPKDFGFDSCTVTAALGRDSQQLYARVEGVLKRWCEQRRAAMPFERLTTHVRSEDPAKAIVQLASDVEAELVI